MSGSGSVNSGIILVGLGKSGQHPVSNVVHHIHAGIPPGPPSAHFWFVSRFLKDVLDGYRRVRFPLGMFFHEYICRQHGFQLERVEPGPLPGGLHFFYVVAPVARTEVIVHPGGVEERVQPLWIVLLRVKTTGTVERRRPHITVSAATGLSWDEEHYKYNYLGLLVPKDLPDGHPKKHYWADTCHFNFRQ